MEEDKNTAEGEKETDAVKSDVAPEYLGSKEKMHDKECHCATPLVVGVSADGQVGEEEMGHWLEEVWFKNVPSPNFLLADCFNVHTAPTVQKLLLQV